jgi:hypothetical protein
MASKLILGPSQPSIQRVPGTLSLEVQWPGYEADHSPLSCVFMASCLIKHRENIISLCSNLFLSIYVLPFGYETKCHAHINLQTTSGQIRIINLNVEQKDYTVKSFPCHTFLTEVFQSCPQSLQANAETVP